MIGRLAVLGCALLASCETVALPETSLGYLVKARAYLDKGRSDNALYLLESIDESSFNGEDLARYKIQLAEAHYQLGAYWSAFTMLEEFPRQFWTSRFRIRAERLQFDCGRKLAASGWTMLGIVSDLSDGVSVLEHFVTYYPRSPHLADALHILGEAAFKTHDYELAIERYSALVQKAPESEWSDQAAFRLAMSHFNLIEGSSYDSGQMHRAKQELAGYLQSPTTNKAFVEATRKALGETLRLIEEKHLQVARFYLTVGNPFGALREVDLILAQPDPIYGAEAREVKQRATAMEAAAERKSR